jgi:2'-hydroxyisoflavone reductase
MSTTRRTFLFLAAGTLAASAGVLGATTPKKAGKKTGSSPSTPSAPAAAPGAPGANVAPGPSAAPAGPRKLLIFGGTGFLGPAVVEAARARGYQITLFNRGKTRPELFPDLEKLRGDRDPDKDGGLKTLEGRQWDAVIDDTGYFPRMVKASAELLAPNVKQYE